MEFNLEFTLSIFISWSIKIHTIAPHYKNKIHFHSHRENLKEKKFIKTWFTTFYFNSTFLFVKILFHWKWEGNFLIIFHGMWKMWNVFFISFPRSFCVIEFLCDFFNLFFTLYLMMKSNRKVFLYNLSFSNFWMVWMDVMKSYEVKGSIMNFQFSIINFNIH